MKIITRYILRLYFSILAISLFGFVGLYLVIDFFEKIDDILEKGAAFGDAFWYFVLKIPFILTQGIPMTALLATLITFWILQRNREIVALKAAGLSLRTYGAPVVAASFLVVIVHFGIGENIARTMTAQAQRIWDQKIDKKKGQVEWKHENVWYHGRDVIYQIRLYDSQSQTFQNVSLFFLDSNFKLMKRLDAKRLRWTGHGWMAEDGALLDLSGKEVEQTRFSRMKLSLQEKPEDFAALETLPEELEWVQLYRYIEKMKNEGYAAVPLEVELYFRMAFPLTTLFLVMIGTAVSLRQGLHGRITVGITVALVIGSLYLAMLQVGTALASAGIFPPAIGVWAGNAIFGMIGIYLWASTPQ